MNTADLLRAFASGVVDQNNRPIRLNWGQAQRTLEQVLALQYADIREGLMTGIAGHLTCVSARADLPIRSLIGLPVSVQMTTDRGRLHAINGIVTDVRAGQSDGSLACYQLTIRDVLSVMERRTNSRIFRSKSLPDILDVLLHEWRQRSPALARAFEFDLSGLRRERYPARELTRQVNESDAHFIRRLLRRDGATVFAKAGKSGDRNDGAAADTPIHTLVFTDDPMKLPETEAGTVRYHRDAATEARDSITLWATRRSLIPGSVARPTWDYKNGRMSQTEQATIVDQGEAGNDIAHLLADAVIDIPHAGDSSSDLDRIGKDRMLAHELRAESVDGASGVRDLAVGHWFTLAEHPQLDTLPVEQRQFIVTSLHHRAQNNLPKELNARAQSLFAASRALFDAAPPDTGGKPAGDDDTRYENTFSCVRRGVPLTPAYDPGVDLPAVHPMTAVVVGPEGEEVFCDEMGRIRVQIQGLSADDHAHAQGAGTSGAPADSAPVRVACALAGPTFGANTLPRVGMEVLIGHIGGDPDRLVVLGVLANGPNMPATFSHTGALPGNRYLSGTKTKEIKGQRYNQIRFDDTPGQISSQLASEHAHSQLNLGFLTQPRENGQGAARGEGAELRSDAHVAIRSGKAMLISAWQRLRASDGHLARDEYLQLMQECVELFKSLGDYAAQHQGVAMDTQPHDALMTTVRGWPNGEASGGDGASGGEQAAIGITAPAGISVATPKTVTTHAGGNVDTVAQNHLQYTSGQRINLHAGHGVQMFAHSEGVSAIANQGKVRLQSQNDDTQIDSAKNIQMTAAGGKLAGMASEQVVFVTSGGAYLKLQGGDIELGCPGSFTVKSAAHTWAGPANMSTDFPKFEHAPLGRVPKLVRATDGQPVEGMEAEVRKASGEVIKGKTDAAGTLSPVSSDQFEQLAVRFFKPRT
ncbi:type IV secretion protein Rhs [Burkholderia stagnalis]|uniref:type VI secretion system Vgr family protein n=1 Tax=Burkholderia stagnalis TaxID=1503054 RepID=UPI000754375B|nr:type VI secretion system Vgr family protein [Burkholderia stagnalis]KVN13151.1 type IV secretion protein Rhs [Burkholderia stagnalis]